MVAKRDGRGSFGGCSGGGHRAPMQPQGRRYAALAEPMTGDRIPSETIIHIYDIC
jgi:hypothetical protein